MSVARPPDVVPVSRLNSVVVGECVVVGMAVPLGKRRFSYDIAAKVGGGGAGVSLSVSGKPVRPDRCEQLRVRRRVRVLPLREWLLRLQQARR